MKKLTIHLSEEDFAENSLGFILESISKHLIKGFHTGIDFPVNWELKEEDSQEEIYFVYEVDEYNSYNSIVIKHCTNELKKAQEFFNLNMSSYVPESENYNFVLASYFGTKQTQSDSSDIKRDFRTILTTEK